MDSLINLKTFHQFVLESKESELQAFAAQKGALDVALEMGAISPQEYKKEMQSLRKSSTQQLSFEELYPEAVSILSSPEFKQLVELGLVNVSSGTQLNNGNLIMARPGYSRHSDYALGFFPDLRVLRRITPKRKYKNLYGGWNVSNVLDQTIKKFDTALPVERFFRVAARWALDHIDFETASFTTKQRTAKDYFDRLSDDFDK